MDFSKIRKGLIILLAVIVAGQLWFYFRHVTLVTRSREPNYLTTRLTSLLNLQTVHQDLSTPPSDSNVPISHVKPSVKKFIKNYEQAIQKGRAIPLWQQQLYNRTITNTSKKNFFLTHILNVRIYKKDLAKWTLRELKQWMHYMFLIGAEHVYVCNQWYPEDDNLEEQLQQYIDLGMISFKKIHTHPVLQAQAYCYNMWIGIDSGKSRWMTTNDMDEFPFCMHDKCEHCLQRYVQNVTKDRPNLAEISMQNFLLLGQGDRTKNMTIERINRCQTKPANALVKPILKPKYVVADIHRGRIKEGKEHMFADTDDLRMLHYWGSRLQNWGPDTEKILSITVPYTDMIVTWVDRLRNSLLVFGEDDAFSTSTGP